MACGLRCPSPLNLGAAGNYSSLKSLNPCSSSSPASPSPVRAQLQHFIQNVFAHSGGLLSQSGTWVWR